MSEMNPSAPSHVTLTQAKRILGRPKSTIHHWMKPGGLLEAETWYGLRMISIKRVLAKLAQQHGEKQTLQNLESAPEGNEEGWDD